MYWILLDNYIVLLSCFPTIASHVLLLSLLWWHSCLGTVLFTTFNVFMPQLLAGDGWRRPAMELLWAESACLHRLSQILGHCLKHNNNVLKASMPGPGKKIFVIMQEVVFVLNFNKEAYPKKKTAKFRTHVKTLSPYLPCTLIWTEKSLDIL